MTIANDILHGATVFDRAVEVWGTPERAAEWLECPDSTLAAKPADLAESEDGLIRVLHQLRSIELLKCA